MSYCNAPGSPDGCLPDPADDAVDALEDLEFAVSAAIKRAAVAKQNDRHRLKSVDVTVTPIATAPECHRKSVRVSTLFEIEVDGDDLDLNVADVGEELTRIFGKVK